MLLEHTYYIYILGKCTYVATAHKSKYYTLSLPKSLESYELKRPTPITRPPLYVQ
jgi:hypothetical protein